MTRDRTCVCGRDEECSAISAAFYAMDEHDARSSYSSMPRKIRSSNPDYGEEENLLITNQILRAYERHMGMESGTSDHNNNGQRQYIANHHFHPHFITEYTIASSGGVCKLPPLVNEEFLKEGLDFGLTPEDRVLDEKGIPTGEYFLVPSYTIEQTKRDLQKLDRVNQKMKRAKDRFRNSATNYEEWSNRSDPLERSHSMESQFSWRTLHDENKDKKKEDRRNSQRRLSTKSFLDNLIEDEDVDDDDEEGSYVSNGDVFSLDTLSNCSFDESHSSDEENKHPHRRRSFLDPEISVSSIQIKSESEMLLDNHTNLQRAEAKRHGMYQQKVEDTRMKIAAALEMLKNGKHELYQAERLIVGSAKAAQEYAKDMEAILRCDGNQENQEKSHWFSKDGDGSSADDDSSQSSASQASASSLMKMSNCVQFPEDQFVDVLCARHFVICEHYSKYAERILSTIAHEANLAREELEVQINKLVDTATRLDNLAGTVLFQFEPDIVDAWDQYMAKKILRDKTNQKQALGEQNRQTAPTETPTSSQLRPLHYKSPTASSSPTSALAFPGISKKTLNIKFEKEPDEDLWLAQMPYLSAKYQQTRTWSRFSYELQKVFDEITEVETERRTRLQELLLEFVPRQRRLSNSVGSVLQAPFLQDLANRHCSFTPEQVENEIKRGIKARKIRQPIINRCSNPRLEQFQLDIHTLDSPVNSGMVVAAKVLERKILKHQRSQRSKQRKIMTKTAWQTCLAVVTADSYLHLVDLPCVSSADTPAEVALEGARNEQEKNSRVSFPSITSLANTLTLNAIKEGECEDIAEESKNVHQLFRECEYDARIPITSDGLLLLLKNREGTVIFDGYCKPSHGKMGPAERNNLVRQKGDTVVSINGISTVGMAFPDVINLIHLTLLDTTRKFITFRFEDIVARSSAVKSLEPNQAFDAFYLGRDPTSWLKEKDGIRRALEQLSPSESWYLPTCEIQSKTNDVFGETMGEFELSAERPPPQINLPFNLQIPHPSSIEIEESEDLTVQLPFNVQLSALSIKTKKLETNSMLLRAGSSDGRSKWMNTLLEAKKAAVSSTIDPVES